MLRKNGFYWTLAQVGVALLILSATLTPSHSQQTGPAQCDIMNCTGINCVTVGIDCPGPRSNCVTGTSCDGCTCKKVSNACQCRP